MPRIKIHIELLDDQGNHMVNDLETGATDKQDAEHLITRAVFTLQDTVKRMLENPAYVRIPAEPIVVPVPLQPIAWPAMPATPPIWQGPYHYDTGTPLTPTVTIDNGVVVEDPNKPISMADHFSNHAKLGGVPERGSGTINTAHE